VRGLGLMLAVEIDSADKAKQIAGEMLRQRIVINRTSETVLRFLPPFILGNAEIDIAVDALDAIFSGQAPQEVAAGTTGGKHVG